MADLNPERATPPPSILNEISAALKEKGVFERDLTPQEVEQMMREVILGMIADSGKVEASVNDLSVTVKEAKAKLQAKVGIVKPRLAKGTMDLSLRLENSTENGKLQLSEEPKGSTDGGFGSQVAINRAKTSLSNPNELIFKGLSKYFAKDGVQLQDMALTLGPNTLGVRLQSTV